MSGRLALACGAALLVVVSAPFVGQLRGALQDRFPDQYRLIIVAFVVVAATAAVGGALARIRERRTQRYGLIAAAVVAGFVYAMATSTGNASVDAVERFHFVEYGLLTFLFYRAWHGRPDAGALVLPALAAFATGLLDEWLQWFVPARVGEFRDVLLNGVSIGCGLVFSLGALPAGPPQGGRVLWTRRAPISPGTAWATAAVVVASAAFFHLVHLGHEVSDAAAGTFRSRFRGEGLVAAARDRERRWQASPPTELRRLSREDHYLAEGLWHVQRRNEAEGEGDLWAAAHENLILEVFFAPVLDTPSYAAPAGARWTPERRVTITASAAADPRPYASDAHPHPIYTWNRFVFWLAVGAVVLLIVGSASRRVVTPLPPAGVL